jgi:hypothetical protein
MATRKSTRLQRFQIPTCHGHDGTPGTASFRVCRAKATHRVEWTSSRCDNPGQEQAWTLTWAEHPDQGRACDRHLPALLTRADHDVHYARYFLRSDTIPDPKVIGLDFPLNKRALAHGRTEYDRVETPVNGPLPLALF